MKTELKTKLKLGLQAVVPIIIIMMVLMSFTLSIVSYSKSVKTDRNVAALTEEVAKLTNDISLSLQAIEAHVSMIEKYAVDNYNFFYGVDRVKVKTNKNQK